VDVLKAGENVVNLVFVNIKLVFVNIKLINVSHVNHVDVDVKYY